MRLGLLALAALFIAAFAAHFLLDDRGYVLIALRGYTIEMSVPALLVSFVILYAAVRGIWHLWRAPRTLGAAVARRSERKAGDRLTKGLLQLAAGDWRRGERSLTQGIKGSSAPLINYLMAARAADRQGEHTRRDEWLARAREALPEAEIAILLTRAELELESGERERARATLEEILAKEPDHAASLVLYAQALIALDDRAALRALLPRLARSGAAGDELAAVAANALEGIWRQPAMTLDEYRALWSALPGDVRAAPAPLRWHARVLDKLGAGDQAVKELAAALKRSWNADLVRAFGEVEGSEPLKQLERAEGWLKAHAEDGMLLLTVGRLCIANELWGKARSYLESSLALAPSPEAYAEYGALLDHLGEREQATLAYHSGLNLASGTGAPLPALTPPERSGS